MPMHRCIASAAGGTSQRLKTGPAMMRSRSKKAAEEATFAADISCSLSLVWLFPGVNLQALDSRPSSTHCPLFATLDFTAHEAKVARASLWGRYVWGDPGRCGAAGGASSVRQGRALRLSLAAL